MNLNLFQIATMGLGPGRTLLSDSSFGFLGLEVVVEVFQDRVAGGAVWNTPKRVSTVYTVKVKITFKGHTKTDYFRLPKILGDLTIGAYQKVKESVFNVRSWFIGKRRLKEVEIKAYLKD